MTAKKTKTKKEMKFRDGKRVNEETDNKKQRTRDRRRGEETDHGKTRITSNNLHYKKYIRLHKIYNRNNSGFN